jgi:serine phosphatase RsbU (regulator of sigma subunit)
MIAAIQTIQSYFSRVRSPFLVLLAVIFWLAYTVINLSQVFARANGMASEISESALPLLLIGFVISAALFFRGQVDKARRLNLMDLLYRMVVTGGVALLAGALSLGVFSLFSDNKLAQNPLFINLLYDVTMAASLVYLVSAFTIFKRLILFQKTKALIFTWSLFELGLLASLFTYLFDIEFFSQLYLFYIITFGLLGIYLSFNLKWVAYLSFKEKWKTILFMLLNAAYLYSFINLLVYFNNLWLGINLVEGIFFGAIFNFIGVYGLFSFLVTLFNLPTSSVFEQKVREAMNIQKLSESIQEQKTEDEIYQMFFNSSVSVVFADAAFLELKDAEGKYFISLTENLTYSDIEGIKAKIKAIQPTNLQEQKSASRVNKKFKFGLFNSLLEQCLIVRGEEVARLYLLKEVSDGFNDEMQSILTTFSNQTSISIENIRLIHETVMNERYQREIKIARQVQKALLPQKLPNNQYFTVSAAYHTADEVGGDYYDIYTKSDQLCAIVIADVSGKGTSAAFHMAQLKGIFQSLSELEMEPATFLSLANSALSRSLDAKSFITATYNLIDARSQTIWTGRAGHCPTIMYHKSEQASKFYLTKGIGLGMIRTQDGGFEKLMRTEAIQYESGDIMLLYTDGIIEARNNAGKELGYQILGKWLEEMATMDAEAINQGIRERLSKFCQEESVGDDYTLLVIKFN